MKNGTITPIKIPILRKGNGIELNMSPETKEQLQLASLVSGITMSSFIISAAYEKAQEILHQHKIRTINKKAFNELNNLITSAFKPSSALKNLLKGKAKYDRKHGHR